MNENTISDQLAWFIIENFTAPMAIFEKGYLTALPQRHKGNLSAAAREADLSRLHLRMLARRYGIAAGSDKDE